MADVDNLKPIEKIKVWRDKEWFCAMVNDGANMATISMTRDEANALRQKLTYFLCCGKEHCNASEHCYDHDMSPDAYAEWRGCEAFDS